jgi:hypothetical protein
MPPIMPPKSLAYNVYNEHNRQQKSPDSLRIKALLDNTERIRTLFGGERGIRTLGTLLTYTRFPGVRLKPLGHLTNLVMD